MITTQIILTSKAPLIDDTLASLTQINTNILIGDMGADDETLNICRNYRAEIVKINNNSLADARNYLADLGQNEWNFYIQPWETLAFGAENFTYLMDTTYFQIYQGQTINKEIRYWNKELRFVNPIFETINKSAPVTKNIGIHSNLSHVNYEDQLKKIKTWKGASPAAAEPHYYEACIFLNIQRYDSFLKSAERYLFLESTQDNSYFMLLYYIAMVKLYHFSDAVAAVNLIMTCIGYNPLMAEFWCLLGDAHYKLNKLPAAIAFYENAILLGKHRPIDDKLPIDIPKYKSYPTKMIAACKGTQPLMIAAHSE